MPITHAHAVLRLQLRKSSRVPTKDGYHLQIWIRTPLKTSGYGFLHEWLSNTVYRCISLWLAQQLQIKLLPCTFGCLELNLAYPVQKPWTEYKVIVELGLLWVWGLMRIPKRPLLYSSRYLQQRGVKWGIDTVNEVSRARLLCTSIYSQIQGICFLINYIKKWNT